MKHAFSAAVVLTFACIELDALAFDAVSRPWPVTPERIIEMNRDSSSTSARELFGLQTVSRRANGAPAVLWASSTPAPRALSAEAAERLALETAAAIAPSLQVEAADLFVLGSTPLEFSAIDPVAHVRSWISVTLGQTYRGLPVGGGALIFVFRDGNLASIRNDLAYISLADEAPILSAAPGHLEIWVPSDEPTDARLAYAVKKSSLSPRAELIFHIDAKSGAILAADDQLRWADGEGRVRISVDTLNTVAGTVPFVAKAFSLPGGATDGDGDTLQNGSARLTYDGPYATVEDQAGQQIETFNLQFAGPFKNYDITPTIFSQADPFVHINRVKEYARTLAPNMQWIDQKLTINVNINDTCNAFWDGATVNFFRAGGGCNNTARLSGVVYHEFGHGFHQFLTNNVVGSVGEGTGDFLASLMLDDPTVGEGFSTNGAGIREIDSDRVFPGDIQNEVHEDGLIWASALWDLRAALEAKHGAWAGKMIVARMFVLALTQGPGLSTAYPAVISADDDDNNPSNGTPNSCEINAVFDRHGLVDGGVLNHALAGTRSFARIDHFAPGAFNKEADGSVKLNASAENRSTCGTIDLASMRVMLARGASGGMFTAVPMIATGMNAVATISDLAEGDIFRYYFEITADGYTYQNGNESSPHVGFVKRAGEVDISRERFESGFGPWTHGALTGDRVDDWETAAPVGLVFDPYEPREGAAVAGTDLGGGGGPSGTDGASKRSTYLQSPAIPTTGMENIQLGLWQHHAIAGSLRIKVDGVEVWSYRGDGSSWSEGWRYVSIPLGASARDNSAGVVLRFESESAASNELGGWSIDDVAITGVAIPPPPPPEPKPEEPKEPPPMLPEDPVDGGGNTGMGNDGGVERPDDPAPSGPQQEPDDPLLTEYSGSIGGSCACVSKPADHRSVAGALLLVGLGLTLAKRRRAR